MVHLIAGTNTIQRVAVERINIVTKIGIAHRINQKIKIVIESTRIKIVIIVTKAHRGTIKTSIERIKSIKRIKSIRSIKSIHLAMVMATFQKRKNHRHRRTTKIVIVKRSTKVVAVHQNIIAARLNIIQVAHRNIIRAVRPNIIRAAHHPNIAIKINIIHQRNRVVAMISTKNAIKKLRKMVFR